MCKITLYMDIFCAFVQLTIIGLRVNLSLGRVVIPTVPEKHPACQYNGIISGHCDPDGTLLVISMRLCGEFKFLWRSLLWHLAWIQ